MITTAYYDSPVGRILLAANGEFLTGLWFEDQKYFAAGLAQCEPGENEVLRQTSAWLDRYFDGQRPDPAVLKTDPQGSPFRRHVWDALLRIPYGETSTYARLGRDVGCLSARAVGGAVGHNPISIIIPCHRILGSDGSLTGYAGGIERKRYLLRLEGTEI